MTDQIDPTQWLRRNSPVVTPERLDKGDVELVQSERGGSQVRSFSNPLDFYHAKRIITPQQFDAGNKLHQLWYYGAGSSGYVLMRYTHTKSNSDAEAAALVAHEYREAMKAIRGVPQKRVAYNVCCMGETIAQMHEVKDERLRGKSLRDRAVKAISARTAQRRCMEQLKAALDDLADHFGY